MIYKTYLHNSKVSNELQICNEWRTNFDNMHCAEVHGDHRNTVESMLHVNEAHDFQTRSFGK